MGSRLAILAIALAATLLPASPLRAQGDYVIGPLDVLAISVWDQADLAGKYTVEQDGTLSFPMIGRVKAAGLSIRQLEEQLRKLLADGYFRNPQVTVAIDQYRSQRIFVVGEVRSPGIHPLTGGMTIIEALARAGASDTGTATEVIIVRPPESPNGPLLPGEDQAADVIKVDVKALQAGDLSQNHQLRDGDTIFVPRAETVYAYVFGHVRSPGAYAIRKDTTVLQALSLAGGVTELGAVNRIKIVRLVDGKKQEIKVKLNDLVQPGDTIIVPQRYF